MTDQTDKPLREMEAEAAEFSEQQQALEEPRQEPSRLQWPLILALVALLAAITLAGFGYQLRQHLVSLQQQLEQTFAGNQSTLEQAKEQMLELREGLQQQASALQQQKEHAEQMIASLDGARSQYQQGRAETLQALNDLQRRMGRSTSRWMAAEAEYLIRIANHRLQLEGDSRTALSALQAADERLKDTADPLWTPVREVLAEDMVRLRSLSPPDYVGLSARLAGLSRQVERLQIKSALLNQPLQQTEAAAQQPLDWEKVFADGWQGFRSLVVVRRHDQPVAAMLPPEQRFFLGQNLRLQLESARLALLRRDQALYEGSLQTALAWLKDYFETEDAATAALRADLEQMLGIRVRMELPDVSGALAVLGQQMEQSQRQGEQETAP